MGDFESKKAANIKEMELIKYVKDFNEHRVQLLEEIVNRTPTEKDIERDVSAKLRCVRRIVEVDVKGEYTELPVNKKKKRTCDPASYGDFETPYLLYLREKSKKS